MSNGPVVWAPAQERWFHTVNQVARTTPWLHAPARLFAEYGVVVFALLLLASWLLARRDGDLRRVTASLWAPLGTLVAVAINQPLVHAFAEPRPYTVLPHSLVLIARSSDYSFPSDHATMAGAVVVGVWLANRRLGVVTLVLALLMAATRVYVGAHFPLDVVAGLVVGSATALVTYALARPLGVRLVTALAATPVRPLLSARPAPAAR